MRRCFRLKLPRPIAVRQAIRSNPAPRTPPFVRRQQLKDQSRDDWKIQAFNDGGRKYEDAIETCVEYALKRPSVRKAYFDNSFATRVNATGFLWHDRRRCALSLDRRARGRRACRALRCGQR